MGSYVLGILVRYNSFPPVRSRILADGRYLDFQQNLYELEESSVLLLLLSLQLLVKYHCTVAYLASYEFQGITIFQVDIFEC